ncbi:leucine rich repeat family protein [Stylonychia lemnae]|uniref:Leucine rich repeat family protein n=1 Tax=Stylonychia lemnae TaxID=5949 RepID=A0A077ZVK7_STYLE|nr:leucine rich repeat family protein [Stylonychia lemnae]|eukprot:CDW73960.1 leucine rich repeat family protein [Stylonychia lemnae]
MDNKTNASRKQNLLNSQQQHNTFDQKNTLSSNKKDLSTNHLDSEQNQISQFNVQSTEMFSTKIDGQIDDASKDETSLFDKQLYDRSLMENASQDLMIGNLQHSQFISQEDINGNKIQETLSENQESGHGGNSDEQTPHNQSSWRKTKNDSQDREPQFFDSETSQNKNFKNRNSSQRHVVDTSAMMIEQSPYHDAKQYALKRKEQKERQPLPMKKTTIDRIIYPVYTKRGIKYGKKRATSQEQKLLQMAQQEQMPEKMGKLLDGFLILYSCRVKLPHESIKSKLASQKIVEVIEEDLCYFQNLNSIDLSDNRVRLEQLKNLKALSEVNLQYNMIQTIPALTQEDFPKLEYLNLSYNSITPSSIRSLFNLKKLKTLDLQGNSLVTLPDDMFELSGVEELNLSSNLFSSSSTIINPAVLFKSLGMMPRLKRLNISRNKFSGFHFDFLIKHEDYKFLQDLDFGYNVAHDEEDLSYLSQLKCLQLLIITGNPLGLSGKPAFARLEEALQKNLSATIINEEVNDQKIYLKKTKQQKQLVNFPYPNPIKLFSREVQKDIKGEYLNAELMNQGVALQIAEIRPNTNIEKEIFPRELTRDAQEKEIFTPPNHKQMRFVAGQDSSKPSSSQNDQFFITENIDQQDVQRQRIIQEERSQESDIEEENDQVDGEDIGEDEEEDLEMQDENFDFGKAKLDYFKSRAREILLNDKDQEYDNSISLNMCYKNLKNQLRNPVVVHNTGSDTKPGYLKMTFSMCRNAVNGDRFLELSKLQQSSMFKSKISDVSKQSYLGGQSRLPPLMLAGKQLQNEDETIRALLGSSKKKTKKEEQIDRKIEYLLETYKKQDEEIMRKAVEKDQNKTISKKILRDKFGFSDDEDDNSKSQNQNEKKVKQPLAIHSAI